MLFLTTETYESENVRFYQKKICLINQARLKVNEGEG